MDRTKILLTGDRPTGKLHLGHYFGSLVNRIHLQKQQNAHGDLAYQQFIMIADMQALSDNGTNSHKITDNIKEILLDYYAVGLIDLDQQKPSPTIFLQSAIPALSELTMYYMNLVSESRVMRNPTVKTERKQKNYNASNTPFGFLAYPISQAADITAFKADFVPVGADQLPMIELTNEIVEKFNKHYGDVLKHSQAIVTPSDKLSRLLGTDGEHKMSKSLNNAIFLSDSSDELWIKIKKMRTCTRNTIQDPGKLAGNVVFYFLEIMYEWYKSAKPQTEFLQLFPKWRDRYVNGGNDSPDYAKDIFLKEQLFKAINELITPIRLHRQEGIKLLPQIYENLEKDIIIANNIAKHTLDQVKFAMGMFVNNK